MQYFPFVVVAWIVCVGLYGVVTSRHLVHQVICLIVVQSSTYVLLLGVGYVTGAVAPYYFDVPVHTPAVDPVVQALALTDVVVEAAVTRPADVVRDPGAQAVRHRGPAGTGLAEGIACRGPAARPRRGRAVAGGRRDHRRRAAARQPAAGTGRGGDRRRRGHRGHARGDHGPYLRRGRGVLFAGFRPAHQVAIGIDFEAGSLSAGLAALAAVLVTAAMTFSWRYFEGVATYYHTLMLTFLAGMTGFCLTGDVFDLFVWFELMGVSAYALTAYRPEERGPIQGALNFAVTNSVGAYLSLSGIAVIYGRTGALNMAQIGAYIGRHPPDGLVAAGFLLIVSGLLIKSAIVPFHFWLADAHAVAPTPVCVLFSGVMVELGLYGFARVYWSIIGQALGPRAAISHLFVALGVLTAVVGALFCFRERHVKRLLAFSTISHAGLFLTGIGLLTPLGLAGTAVYVIGHGLVKAALFLCVGIVLHRLGSVNETWLHGRGRQLRVTGVVFTLAGLGLADLPTFATFLGKGYLDASAWAHGLPWVMPVFIICAILVGGAVLRVAGGVFYGLGDPPSEDPKMAKMADEETSETDSGRQRTRSP